MKKKERSVLFLDVPATAIYLTGCMFLALLFVFAYANGMMPLQTSVKGALLVGTVMIFGGGAALMVDAGMLRWNHRIHRPMLDYVAPRKEKKRETEPADGWKGREMPEQIKVSRSFTDPFAKMFEDDYTGLKFVARTPY